jgi:hypothetical protein
MDYKEETFTMGRCAVTVSKDKGKWHLSISTPYESPKYSEVKKARYQFLPDDIYVAQIFPPKKEFINIHPYCHHLWEL